MRRIRAFTIIEMMVVLLLIAILAGIVLAVGSQVQQNSQRKLTQTTLRNLQAALDKYIHKTGQTPANMLAFLEGYQLMHAYQAGSIWEQHANVITDLPSTMVVTGELPPPTGTVNVSGVVEILDAYGNPIQYMPPSGDAPIFYPQSGGTPLPSPIPPNIVYAPAPVGSGATSTLPAQDSHTPYFYSFGPSGPPTAAANNVTSAYTYSYAP